MLTNVNITSGKRWSVSGIPLIAMPAAAGSGILLLGMLSDCLCNGLGELRD
jgi:hypothetical protein